MKRKAFIAFSMVCLILAMSTYAADTPLVNISVKVGRSRFEVGERTGHTLMISNQSADETISVPSFRFLNVKQEDPEIAFYLKEQVLRLQVTVGTNAVPIHQEWLIVPERATEFPSVELRPGESVATQFSLTRRWYPSFYALTNPGTYAVSVILDTTKTTNPKVLKGVFVSAPAEFEIIPVPTFRARGAGETKADYGQERVAFYLKRIMEHTGEYFPNVGNIVRTEDGVPALIELMEAGDPEIRSQAVSLLKQFHHAEDGRSDHPALPGSSLQAWREWWQTTGSKLSTEQVWHNFDSRYQ